ncbi:hypothetical protein FRACYDRAFT_244441 [Fragilariopsis cylindrus CCMP1102]|uniref:Uncharacterized protein n=1 Tax=Fragilariopsis cylindrus CCMP1102 TaxID=635003 RepID=A0A1E7F241_9STRA|nr:hypothetical protein FRACYDRAFT_244441 [Fragilariopsis cylindrus CCMP1102]|eukprot:OEU12184.1 hypothetical protein FRACYDRAFT_244441 [Fragilariopsis cylindrus CCMP1102]
MTITNSLARSSCTKCVEVLQELVSGLQQDNAGENNNNNTNNNNSNSNSNTKNEPSPLTLLKAIARSSHQQRNEYDQWGQQQRPKSMLNSKTKTPSYCKLDGKMWVEIRVILMKTTL